MLSIIPARGGSKGIPKKNIKDLAGKPLINYTIKASIDSDRVDRTMVTTNDEDIASVSRKAGAEVPFIRPKRLAQDETPTLPVIQHTLNYYQDNENYTPDAVILLQPTSPLRTSNHIDEALRKYEKLSSKSLVSVCKN